MNAIDPQRLRYAVQSICPDIELRIAHQPPLREERHLWWELSCCVLSSQVPFALAVAAADAIAEKGLLLDESADADALTLAITNTLSSRLRVGNKSRSYRFPIARGKQLAQTRAKVTLAKGNLVSLLGSFENIAATRDWFVENAAGVGPKQASMFLRNTGISYDLAILDRHVLSYMSALGLYHGLAPRISQLAQYRRHEEALRSHAQTMGYQVGMMDWAIWIVMRVAHNRQTELVV
jgi:N-glycosylase/DNA lyase